MALRTVGSGSEADLDMRAITDEHDIVDLDELTVASDHDTKPRGQEALTPGGDTVPSLAGTDSDEDFDRWATTRRPHIASSAYPSPPGTARLPAELPPPRAKKPNSRSAPKLGSELAPSSAGTASARGGHARNAVAALRVPRHEPRRAAALAVLALAVVGAAVVAINAADSSPSRPSAHRYPPTRPDTSASKAQASKLTLEHPRTAARSNASHQSARRSDHPRASTHRLQVHRVVTGPRPTNHSAATTSPVSATASGAGSTSDTSGQQTATQQPPAQQPSSNQPAAVHYQAAPQPAGPSGLGSQVGSNCNPKCT